MPNEAPQGRRYSHVYLPKAEPIADSPRLRLRLAAVISSHVDDLSQVIALKRELGIGSVPSMDRYLPNAPLVDVLDTITIMHNEAYREARWVYIRDVRRVLEEESAPYRLDDWGGVHPLIDVEFERSRVAALASLGKPHHGAALAFYEQATDAWEETPPNWRDGIRHLFDAAETLFKLAFSSQPRLTPGAAQTELKALIDAKYQRDPVSQRVAHKMLASFNDWIEAAQFYRHAPGQEQPSQPPDELAIQMLGTGTAFVRWLAEFLPHGAP